jgi:hypothetical protein
VESCCIDVIAGMTAATGSMAVSSASNDRICFGVIGFVSQGSFLAREALKCRQTGPE